MDEFMSSSLWKIWRLKGKFHSLEMSHRRYCYINSLDEFQIMDFSSEHTCLHGDGRSKTGLQSPMKEARGPSLLPNAQENFSDEGQPCKGTLALFHLERISQICPPVQHPADRFSRLTPSGAKSPIACHP